MIYNATTSLALSKRIVAALEKNGKEVPPSSFFYEPDGTLVSVESCGMFDRLRATLSAETTPSWQLHEILEVLVESSGHDTVVVGVTTFGVGAFAHLCHNRDQKEEFSNPDPTEAAGLLWVECEEGAE